jgi:hypothetical protein
MSVELLPCPFCGAPGIIRSWGSGVNRGRCSDATCPMMPDTGILFTAEEAAAVWNRRAPIAVNVTVNANGPLAALPAHATAAAAGTREGNEG